MSARLCDGLGTLFLRGAGRSFVLAYGTVLIIHFLTGQIPRQRAQDKFRCRPKGDPLNRPRLLPSGRQEANAPKKGGEAHHHLHYGESAAHARTCS